MSEHKSRPVDIADKSNGKPSLERPDWPCFASLDQAEEHMPRLGIPGAWPIARDRWERVVTSHYIPVAPEQVWKALSDPAALKLWLAVCNGSLEEVHRDCVLDFEDGEFFLCHPVEVSPPHRLEYLWRWLGIGPATAVIWQMERKADGTQVIVTEEAINPPRDWQSWHGEGWPGILGQLANYLRTGIAWRWPWRRMGPYAVMEFPLSVYESWDRLFNPAGLKYWLLTSYGAMVPGQSLTILMGDASGMIEMIVHEVVQPGQSPPSFLPYVTFSMKRPGSDNTVNGRLWLEPGRWGYTIFQVFIYGWENISPESQLSERKILTGFWADAALRANMVCGGIPAATEPYKQEAAVNVDNAHTR